MKNFNSFLITTSITILIFAATLLTSCKKDVCKDYVCQNGGTCKKEYDGYGGWGSHPACECATGFEGAYCETESITNLFGNYILSGSDNVGGVYSNLNTTIATSSLGKTKFILDVSGMFNLTCSMSSFKAFNIDPATISGHMYSGSGEYENYYSGPHDSLLLSVTKIDGIDSIVYTLSGAKQ